MRRKKSIPVSRHAWGRRFSHAMEISACFGDSFLRSAFNTLTRSMYRQKMFAGQTGMFFYSFDFTANRIYSKWSN